MNPDKQVDTYLLTERVLQATLWKRRQPLLQRLLLLSPLLSRQRNHLRVWRRQEHLARTVESS